MENPIEKGNKLEEAVELIERVLLGIDSSLKGSLVIERKKIISGPVRHEFDLYVTIDHGHEYKSIFIFECKNWEANVNKNEIMVFSGKIDAAKAQKGFFVAKGYTRDALEQANQDKRIKILYAKDNPIDVSPFPLEFTTFSVPQILEMGIYPFGIKDIAKTKKLIVDIKTTLISYKGEKKNLLNFIDSYAKKACDEKFLEEESHKQFDKDVEYELETEKEILFNEGELFLDKEEIKGKSIEKIYLKTKFRFKIAKLRVISNIDVSTRGTFVKYEPVKFGDTEFKLSMVFTSLPK